MIKTLLKHFIYEACIDTFFSQVFDNFIKPKLEPFLIPRISIKFTMDDVNSLMTQYHGGKVEKQIVDGMTKALTREIDNDILKELVSVATADEIATPIT